MHYFSLCCNKMPEKRKKGRVYSGSWLDAEEGIAAKRAADHSLCLQLGTEREGGQLSVHGMVPPTLSVDLPVSINII